MELRWGHCSERCWAERMALNSGQHLGLGSEDCWVERTGSNSEHHLEWSSEHCWARRMASNSGHDLGGSSEHCWAQRMASDSEHDLELSSGHYWAGTTASNSGHRLVEHWDLHSGNQTETQKARRKAVHSETAKARSWGSSWAQKLKDWGPRYQPQSHSPQQQQEW